MVLTVLPRILIVGPIDPRLDQCSSALSAAGYTVEHSTTLEAKRRIKQNPWEVVILAHTIDRFRRRALGEWIRENGITTRLVTLHPGHNLNPTLVDARASVEDSPAELVQAVRALLGNRERKRKRLLFLTSGSFSPLGRVAFLQRAGYEVIVARTMGEVEEACSRTMFDLVILGRWRLRLPHESLRG